LIEKPYRPTYLTPVEIIEYKEYNCPYCRYVYYEILKRIEDEWTIINRRLALRRQKTIPPVQIIPIDIDANRGSKEHQWFQRYSLKAGGVFTPAVYVPMAGKVLYLFGGKEKPLFLEERWTRKADQMLVDLIRILQDLNGKIYRPATFYDVAPKPAYAYLGW